ncbi:hypothetical protein ACFYT4_34255 [Streptomyces sp. NPDC004609]|uniref:hypothetical protein n=1 Tax=Streptomyces sp. NPDC004609 TaxID=3364704 RepID=UPI003688B9BB
MDRCRVGLDVQAVFFIQRAPVTLPDTITLPDTVKQLTSRTAVRPAAEVTGPDDPIAAVAVSHTDDVDRLQPTCPRTARLPPRRRLSRHHIQQGERYGLPRRPLAGHRALTAAPPANRHKSAVRTAATLGHHLGNGSRL